MTSTRDLAGTANDDRDETIRRQAVELERLQAEVAAWRNRYEKGEKRDIAFTNSEGEVDPLGFGKALLPGDDEQRAVEQRDEAGGDGMSRRHSFTPGSRRLAAVTRLWAISAILRFWFIAVRRSSA